MTETASDQRRGIVASWKAAPQSQKSIAMVGAMAILMLVLFRIVPAIQHIIEHGKRAAGAP